MLVGLQLPRVLDAIEGEYSTAQVVLHAAVITLGVVGIRLVWVFPATYGPRPILRDRDPAPPWRQTLLVGFTGMRGAVSLAAALSIPATVDGGGPWGQYEFRVRRFSARFDEGNDGDVEEGSVACQRLRREMLEAERERVVALRDQGDITDDLMRRIERDLDLEDARLEI